MITVGFGLLLSTKPTIVKFEVEGTATLVGKDEDIRKMLEVDPETKLPYVLPRVYQHAFTAMYLMSTVLNTPPPPKDLLGSHQPENTVQGISVEINPENAEPKAEVSDKSEAAKGEKEAAPIPK
jgi:hypothetical protein